jgi:two-component system heavy metal sensor histidine kinase CusS
VKTSLRRALALRFAATMAVGLTTASAALYWGTARVMRLQLDNALESAAFLFSAGLVNGATALPTEPLLATDPDAYEHRVNRYVVLRSADGRVREVLPHFAADLPLDTTALRRARDGERVWVDGRWHGRGIRAVYFQLSRVGVGSDEVIQVAASLHPLRALRRDLGVALLAVVLLGTAATLVGTWHFTSSAVRPVDEITAQATRIEAGTLDQRIVAHVDTEEYEGLVAVLNRMLERLERGFAAQQRLTADVGHELRTPLTVLRGQMEVALRAERSPRDYQLVLRGALDEIDRLTTLSEDLLLITRADARLLTLERVETDVAALVAGVLDGLRRRTEEKDLTVERSFPKGGRPVSIDPTLVARLVDHLLDNAVRYTPIGGRIGVRVEPGPAADGVRLVVENSGPEIAAHDLAHVFEPFYRVDPARTRENGGGAGPGLGLAMVAAIARLHNGAAHAASGPGGTRFEIDLPTPTSP